jgi:hypothetical protein
LSAAALNVYVHASLFAAAHPLAVSFAGGLLAAFDLYALAQYEEVQAVVFAQPNPGGLVAAQLGAVRSTINQVLKSGGTVRAVEGLSASGARLLRRAQGLVRASSTSANTGQMHHAISMEIWRALERHRVLRGLYRYRDPRFVTQAVDRAAHWGYPDWHRRLDREVANWIGEKEAATQAQFERFLYERYNMPDLRMRFPDGLP